jgi:hypothetical protein
MAFRFKVHRVTHIASFNHWRVDGTLESGKVLIGDEAAVEGDPSRRVKVTGVAILALPGNQLSMNIAPPKFPGMDLEGSVLVGLG